MTLSTNHLWAIGLGVGFVAAIGHTYENRQPTKFAPHNQWTQYILPYFAYLPVI